MGEESAVNQFKFASELERIFSSVEFARSPVMRKLLRFLIDETLAGRGDQLKAYSVAVDGLGRDPDFDAQTDSYPRVQVGRLRRMLEAYYARCGTINGERLVIPNGAYRVFLHPIYRMHERPPVPAPLNSYRLDKPEQGDEALPAFYEPGRANPFLRHGRWARAGIAAAAVVVAAGIAALVLFLRGMPDAVAPAAARTVTAPTLLLLPVETSANSPAALAPSVDQVLGDALHRSWVVDVRSSQGRGDARTTYWLQGVLAGPTGEDLYLTLWNSRSGERVWTNPVALEGQQTSLPDRLQEAVANLVGTFGVIATDQRKMFGSDIRPGYPCLLKNAELRYILDKENFPAARKCLTEMLASNPDSPAALAVAADMNYRIAARTTRNREQLIATARQQAKRALLRDPYSPQAQIVSAVAAVVDGNCPSAKAQGLRAIELNPYEPEYQARLGILLFQCNDPEHEPYLVNARRLNPALPIFFSMPVIAAMLERGEKQEALELALSQTPPVSTDSPYYPMTMAIAYAGAGEKARAENYWRQAMKAAGPDVRTPNELLKSILFSPELIEATGRVLLSAGVVKSLG